MNYIKQILYGSKIKNYLEFGIRHFEEENYFSAITYFSHALELDQNCEEALFNRGSAFFYVNNFQKSIADLEALQKVNSNYNSNSYFILAKCAIALNQYKNAVKYADEYYKLNSNDINAQYFSAVTKYLNNDLAEALNLVDLAIMERDFDFELRYLRSLILFEQENFVSSILDINKAIELDSLNCFTYNLRALINIQLFNYREAINDFSYAIRLNPINAMYYFNKAKIQLKIGDIIEAKNSIEKAIELEKENKSFYLLKGELELLSENNYEALDAFELAYKLDNNDLELLKQIADLKLYLRDYSGAKESFNKVNEISPEDSDAYYSNAFLEYELCDTEESVLNLKKAIEHDPSYTEAIIQNGIIELSLNHNKEAISIFNMIDETDPQFYKSCLYKAQAFLRQDKVDEAEQELKKIGKNYEDNDYHIISSQINYLKENYNDAEGEIERYLNSNQQNGTAKIIKNYLKAKQNKLSEIEELSEFNYEDQNKIYAQIINGIVNFEKGQYYTANFRLANIAELSQENKELISPLIEFASKQIS